MTMPTDLDNLIARLEKAEGPDRELDLAIGEAIGAADHSGPAWHRPFRDWAKHYTASLDAALTLVPEPWMWALHGGAGCYPGVQLELPDVDTREGEIVVEAATTIIALCIAALRARLA